jgi:unsaturated chondroitin disaccharide hydrolase
MSSFGNGFENTSSKHYARVLLAGAKSLNSRYNPTVRAVRSWDRRSDHRKFKVIIDNMMNIQLLFWGTSHGGPPKWRNHAISHAETTIDHFLRRSGSVRHLVNFNPETGKVISVSNPQGYSRRSTWSRGLAWAIHGFSSAYADTARPEFLKAARETARYYLNSVPRDCVPYWDFNDPNIPNAPRDASAGAIAADGLIELAKVDPRKSRRIQYRRASASILESLATHYTAPSGQAILDGSVATIGVDPPNIGTSYGDYYYLHALMAFLDGSLAADSDVKRAHG